MMKSQVFRKLCYASQLFRRIGQRKQRLSQNNYNEDTAGIYNVRVIAKARRINS